jgi:hypothetical protein
VCVIPRKIWQPCQNVVVQLLVVRQHLGCATTIWVVSTYIIRSHDRKSCFVQKWQALIWHRLTACLVTTTLLCFV